MKPAHQKLTGRRLDNARAVVVPVLQWEYQLGLEERLGQAGSNRGQGEKDGDDSFHDAVIRDETTAMLLKCLAKRNAELAWRQALR